MTPAVPADAGAATALLQAAFAGYAREMGRAGPSEYPWMAEAIAAGRVWWLAERAGAAVLTRDGSTLVIDMLAIDPAAQGRGQGRAALTAIEAHARATGATEVSLHTAQQFTRLVAFYARAGYRVHRVGPHPKGRDDRLRVFMVKSLV